MYEEDNKLKPDSEDVTPNNIIKYAVLGTLLGLFFIAFVLNILSRDDDKYVEDQVKLEDTCEPTLDIATQNSIDVGVPSEEPFPTEIIIENCPFCGSKGEIRYLDEGLAWGECTECQISTEHYCCVTSQEAVMQALKAWNRRVE